MSYLRSLRPEPRLLQSALRLLIDERSQSGLATLSLFKRATLVSLGLRLRNDVSRRLRDSKMIGNYRESDIEP